MLKIHVKKQMTFMLYKLHPTKVVQNAFINTNIHIIAGNDRF